MKWKQNFKVLCFSQNHMEPIGDSEQLQKLKPNPYYICCSEELTATNMINVVDALNKKSSVDGLS